MEHLARKRGHLRTLKWVQFRVKIAWLRSKNAYFPQKNCWGTFFPPLRPMKSLEGFLSLFLKTRTITFDSGILISGPIATRRSENSLRESTHFLNWEFVSVLSVKRAVQYNSDQGKQNVIENLVRIPKTYLTWLSYRQWPKVDHFLQILHNILPLIKVRLYVTKVVKF